MSDTPTPTDEIDADQLDDDTPITSELADPDDYHYVRRLRTIHDARNNVRNTFTKSEAYTSKQEHRHQRGELAFALCAYIAELEPLARQLGTDRLDLPPSLPWDHALAYADRLGKNPDTGRYAAYQASVLVFRVCNDFLDDVKPLINETESNEWEIQT